MLAALAGPLVDKLLGKFIKLEKGQVDSSGGKLRLKQVELREGAFCASSPLQALLAPPFFARNPERSRMAARTQMHSTTWLFPWRSGVASYPRSKLRYRGPN